MSKEYICCHVNRIQKKKKKKDGGKILLESK